MYINTFKYTPKDVSCQLCTEYVKKLGCTALRCPWLAERIEAGVVGYREAVLETFPHERRLFQRLNLLIKHYPGSLWSNEQHERRMQYQCVVQGYTREVYPDDDTGRILENFYYIFNDERPGDFVGHSLSVSDIVALKQDGKVSYHYCDSMGFQELPAFQKPENYLKAAEMSMEDDYGMIDGIINNGPKQPTVADLEAQVKAGMSISLMDLAEAAHREKKKSVLEQLKSQPAQERPHKTAPKKSAEKEL